jgi:hypothetical protein
VILVICADDLIEAVQILSVKSLAGKLEHNIWRLCIASLPVDTWLKEKEFLALE